MGFDPSAINLFSDYLWLSLPISASRWLSWAVSGYQGLSKASRTLFDYPWLYHYLRLPWAVSSYRWLFQSIWIFPGLYPYIILGLSWDFPFIITELVLDNPKIFSGLYSGYFEIILGLSQDVPLIIPRLSLIILGMSLDHSWIFPEICLQYP